MSTTDRLMRVMDLLNAMDTDDPELAAVLAAIENDKDAAPLLEESLADILGAVSLRGFIKIVAKTREKME